MRVMSQYICLNRDECVSGVVVEIDDNDVVSGIFSLQNIGHESADTLFLDGIVSGELLSPISVIDIRADVFDYITTYTKPIRTGEKNKLVLWTNVDFLLHRLTVETEIISIS